MSNAVMFRFLTQLDKPKRYLSLTADEVIIAGSGFLLLALCNQKVIVALLSGLLLTTLRYLKKGDNPRVLLVLAYWYLPNTFTQFFLPKLPASHYRVWVA
jgi:conjugal transfer pilus assembly protein TraL